MPLKDPWLVLGKRKGFSADLTKLKTEITEIENWTLKLFVGVSRVWSGKERTIIPDEMSHLLPAAQTDGERTVPAGPPPSAPGPRVGETPRARPPLPTSLRPLGIPGRASAEGRSVGG